MTGETSPQRIKETEMDYRYFPEPDIPPIELKKDYVEKIRSEIPELPEQRKLRYTEEYDLPEETAETLIQDVSLSSFFDEATADGSDKTIIKEVAKWLVGDFTMLTKSHGETKMKPKDLTAIVQMVQDSKVSRTNAKEILEEAYRTGKPPKEILEKKDLSVVSDSSKLETTVKKVVEENPAAIEDLKENPNAIMFLVGQVMKEMQGKADPTLVRKKLEEQLSE